MIGSLIISAATIAAAPTGREVVNFDFAWKHKLGKRLLFCLLCSCALASLT